jgi:hypothetical protein
LVSDIVDPDWWRASGKDRVRTLSGRAQFQGRQHV